MAALAMDESAAIETVLGAEQREEIVAVTFLDSAFDDDEQGVGRRIPGDDGFGRTEVGDIQRRAKRLNLSRCEAVEGRVGGTEGVRHWHSITKRRQASGLRSAKVIKRPNRTQPSKWRTPTVVVGALHLRSAYWAAPRFSIRSSTTLGSARGEVSPRLPNSFSAILRRIRRMIFPERVLGSPGANCMTSGEAIGPVSLRTRATSSLRITSVGVCPAIKVTQA